jgi:hypothetical protein
MVLPAYSKKHNVFKHLYNNNTKQHVVVKAFSAMSLIPGCCSSSSSRSKEEFGMDLPRYLMATATAIVVAAAAMATTTSWSFVTTTSSAGADTATVSTTSTTIGRGGGGGSGGNGGGPMLKTAYPSSLTEKRAQDDVRQWDEGTQNNPYEVSVPEKV